MSAKLEAVSFEYSAFQHDGTGPWYPIYWHNGERSQMWSRGHECPESAANLAYLFVSELASRYVGDWAVSVAMRQPEVSK